MNNPTQLFLVLVIIGGLFGIFVGLNSRRRKGSQLINKPLIRGCFMAASGSIMLALFLGNILHGWIAVTAVGVLIMIQEYAIAAIARFREKRTRPDYLSEDEPLLDVTEEETWEQTRKKGLARFVIVNAALYGVSGVLLTSFTVILLPERFPLYLPIAVMIAGMLGGATAAIRQWNWHERKERSAGVEPGSEKHTDD